MKISQHKLNIAIGELMLYTFVLFYIRLQKSYQLSSVVIIQSHAEVELLSVSSELCSLIWSKFKELLSDTDGEDDEKLIKEP